MNKRPTKQGLPDLKAPSRLLPAAPGCECDEPLPHIKQEPPEAVAAENTNLPESHLYNDPDVPERSVEPGPRRMRGPGWRSRAHFEGPPDPPSRPLVA